MKIGSFFFFLLFCIIIGCGINDDTVGFIGTSCNGVTLEISFDGVPRDVEIEYYAVGTGFFIIG